VEVNLISIGSDSERAATVELSRTELTLIVGGISEGLFEISPHEFEIRVGAPADAALAFVKAVVAVRDECERSQAL
jgi:hypothetical protein